MVEWEWDPAKDRLNRLNHLGLSLAAGVAVLADPLAESRRDPDSREARWQTVGSAGGIAVLFVVHTEPASQPDGRMVGRIIGVRKATAHSGRLTKQAHSDALAQAREAMSPELLAQLHAVAALPDERINTSDIPEVHDWSGAVRGKFYQPPRQRLTLELDADVVEYFRETSPEGGYQAAINRALRAAMLRAVRRRQKASASTP